MSSTNRSFARHTHNFDYYRTPQKPIKDFLEMFCKDENIDLSNLLILDPCAGGDKDNDMSYPAVLFEMGADYNKIITNDIREDSGAKYHKDFTEAEGENKYDLIITNPPFNIAQSIIEKSLQLCKEGGYVVMLLRLNYFGGKCRQEFWKKNIPIRGYIHNKRLSFTDDGKTDSIEYFHCIWQKGINPEEIKIKIIYDF